LTHERSWTVQPVGPRPIDCGNAVGDCKGIRCARWSQECEAQKKKGSRKRKAKAPQYWAPNYGGAVYFAQAASAAGQGVGGSAPIYGSPPKASGSQPFGNFMILHSTDLRNMKTKTFIGEVLDSKQKSFTGSDGEQIAGWALVLLLTEEKGVNFFVSERDVMYDEVCRIEPSQNVRVTAEAQVRLDGKVKYKLLGVEVVDER